MDDDLVAKYAAEAKAAMEAEAARRVAESTDPEEEERLRNTSLHELWWTLNISFPLFSLGSARSVPPLTATAVASPSRNRPSRGSA